MYMSLYILLGIYGDANAASDLGLGIDLFLPIVENRYDKCLIINNL